MQRLSREVRAQADRLDEGTDPLELDDALESELRDMSRQTQELNSRVSRVYGSLQGWVGPLAADQIAQRTFIAGMLESLDSDWGQLRVRLPG